MTNSGKKSENKGGKKGINVVEKNGKPFTELRKQIRGAALRSPSDQPQYVDPYDISFMSTARAVSLPHVFNVSFGIVGLHRYHAGKTVLVVELDTPNVDWKKLLQTDESADKEDLGE